MTEKNPSPNKHSLTLQRLQGDLTNSTPLNFPEKPGANIVFAWALKLVKAKQINPTASTTRLLESNNQLGDEAQTAYFAYLLLIYYLLERKKQRQTMGDSKSSLSRKELQEIAIKNALTGAEILFTPKQEAARDVLTGLWNRRAMMQILEEKHLWLTASNPSWKRKKQRAIIVLVCMIDIDYFKNVNDTYGHQIGDHVLQKVAKIINSETRGASDVCCRYGGEEFLLMLQIPIKDPLDSPKNNDQDTKPLLDEKIRQIHNRITGLQINTNSGKGEQKIIINTSMGVSQLTVEGGIAQAIKEADNKLYQAKKSGRNKVVV